MKKTLLLIILISGIVFSVSAEAAGSLSGRQITEQGEKISTSGSLFEKEGEWYITEEGSSKVYAVHIGNEDYSESIGLKLNAGDSAEVKGFSVGSDIAACTIKTGGKEYVLRDENGTPAWRGSGRGKNRSWERYLFL